MGNKNPLHIRGFLVFIDLVRLNTVPCGYTVRNKQRPDNRDGTHFRNRGCTFPFLPGESAAGYQYLQPSWLLVSHAAMTVNSYSVNNNIQTVDPRVRTCTEIPRLVEVFTPVLAARRATEMNMA